MGMLGRHHRSPFLHLLYGLHRLHHLESAIHGLLPDELKSHGRSGNHRLTPVGHTVRQFLGIVHRQDNLSVGDTALYSSAFNVTATASDIIVHSFFTFIDKHF